MKKCHKCLIEKDVSEFHKATVSKDGLHSICKLCTREYGQKRYYCDHEKSKEAGRLNHHKNKHKWKRNELYHKDWHLKRKFNISLQEYNDILKKQNNCCAICHINKDLTKRDLAVDHDHKTGKISGLLCDNCNLGLGYYRDSSSILRNAIKYLEEK